MFCLNASCCATLITSGGTIDSVPASHTPEGHDFVQAVANSPWHPGTKPK